MPNDGQRPGCLGTCSGFDVTVTFWRLIRRNPGVLSKRAERSHIPLMLNIAALVLTLGWNSQRVFPADKPAGSVETPASNEDEEEVLSTAKTFADSQAAQLVRLAAAQKLDKWGPRAAPVLPVVIRMFADPDWEINRVAQRIVVSIGPAAVPMLIGSLTNTDEQLRFRAARTLVKLGPIAEPMVQELLVLLKHENAHLREDVSRILPQLVPDAAVWLPVLLDSLDSLEQNGQYKVKEMLRRRSAQVLPVLRSLARSIEVPTRVAALRSLAELGEDTEEVAAQFREALRDTEASVRTAACKGLSLREVDFRTLLPLLDDRLKNDSDVEVRIAVLSALGRIRVPDGDAESYRERKSQRKRRAQPIVDAALPVIAAGLQDRDAQVRAAATQCLATDSFRCSISTSRLLQAMDDPDEVVRGRAVMGLASVDDKPAEERVLQVLRSDQAASVRKQAAKSLAYREKRAKSIIPALLAVVQDEAELNVKVAALESLESYELDRELAFPIVKAVMQSDEAKLRSAAVSCLAKVQMRSDEVVELVLLVVTDDREAPVRESAAMSLPIATRNYLDQYGDEAARITKRLVGRVASAVGKAAADDSSLAVRLAALKSLSDHTEAVCLQAVPDLLRAAKDVEPSVRAEAAKQLGRIAANDASARIKLLELTQDSVAAVRYRAIDALSGLPKNTNVVLPALVRGLKDPSPDVRGGATWIVDYLLQEQVFHPAIVGVQIGARAESTNELATESTGILVSDIVAKSPAQAAGLAKNDVILQVNGKQVSDVLRFRQLILQHSSDHPLALTVKRGTEKMTISLTPRAATVGLTEVIPLLINVLDERDPWTRSRALEALVLIGVVPDSAITELIHALDDEEPTVIAQAIKAAVTFGTGYANQIIPKVVRHLEDESSDARRTAATMLGKFGAEAQMAVPNLAGCLIDQASEVRDAAAKSLAKIVPPADHAKIAGLAEALAAASQRPRSNIATLLPAVLEGSRLLKEGQPEAAVEQLQDLIPEMSPADSNALYGVTLQLLVDAHLALNRFEKSREYCQRLLNWKIEKDGEENDDVGRTKYNLAVIYLNLGQHSKTESLAQDSLGVLERTLGSEHLDLAKPLSFLSHLRLRSGQMAEAEKLAIRALEIRRNHLPADHPDLAYSTGEVAQMLWIRGEQGKAEGMFRDAVKAYREAKGKDDSQVAWLLNGLGTVCLGRGDHQAAILHLEEARAILKSHPGESALEIVVLETLRAAYRAAGKNEQAVAVGKTLAFRALRPSTASSTSFLFFQLRGLADSAWMSDWISDAALSNLADRFGEDHMIFAGAQKVLAEARLKNGKYETAEQLYWKCISNITAFAPYHPEIADALQQLGALNVYRGDWQEALDNHRRSRQVIAEYAHRNLPALSEQEQHRFLHQANGLWLARSLSTALAQSEHSAACEMSAEWLFNSKGITLDALQERTQLAQQSDVPEIQQLRENLRDLRERLAYLVTFGGRERDSAGAKQELDQISARERELSKQLSLRLGDQSAPRRWLTVGEIRQVLTPETVLIEIARFPRFTFETKHEELTAEELPEAHYAAWLIPAAGVGSVRLIPLGPAPQIEAAVQKVRDAMAAAPSDVARRGEAESEVEIRKALQEASRLLLEPLKPHLAETSRLLICPDASLWLIPWEALVLDGKYAVERFKISYLVSSRDLLARIPAPTTEAPLVLADPNFSLARSQIASLVKEVVGEPIARGVDGPQQSRLNVMRWTSLPGTALEAKTIVPSLQRYAGQPPRVYLRDRALEAVVKAARHPRILVLSTHGFFLEDQQPKTLAGTSKLARGVLFLPSPELPFEMGNQTGSHIENPLLRCGLVFAGANGETALPEGHAELRDDSILTGLEIVGLDLHGTELVSLSACETSVGQIQNGEGVAGLRQAFHLAGAQNVLASAWKIPDRETADLMSDYFRNLADGADRVAALRNAQLQIIENRRLQAKVAHPYYWAAFTITGHPQDLLAAADATSVQNPQSQDTTVTKSSFLAHIDFARRQFSSQPLSEALATMNPAKRKELQEHLVLCRERLSLGISHAMITSKPDFVYLVLASPNWVLSDQDRRSALTNMLPLSEAKTAHFRRLLADDCDNVRSTLASLRAEAALDANDPALALDEVTAAINLSASNLNAIYIRGLVHQRSGRLDEAIADFTSAIESPAKHVAAHTARATAYQKQGLHDKALSDLEAVIKLTPKSALAYNNAAWYLATCSAPAARDGRKAIQYATMACELTQWKNAYYFDTLAAAHAEVGDFKNAIIWQQKASDSPEAFSPADQQAVQERLKLYQSLNPYRE